jgi:hypothetical protein
VGYRLRLAIILAEFGGRHPDVTQYRETWPEADIQVFTDADVPRIPQFEGPRYGWRANDYWKVRKMLDSGADVAMCFDADMRIVDREAARTLPLLAERFGICLPINPRYLVKVDGTVGADTNWQPDCAEHRYDKSRGNGPSVNCSPIAISFSFSFSRAVSRGILYPGVDLAEAYCVEMLDDPARGPIAWWRAMWHSGISPLILPPQWCVCEKHIGIGNEIILHEGHEKVKRHYAKMETG